MSNTFATITDTKRYYYTY